MRSALFVFLLFTLVGLCALPAQSADQNNLLVISIDGLDHRWLRDADALGVKIPTLRRLMREGARADGVVGIVPTVTWPSHTTMITGVRASRHGVPTNDQPGKPDERWWYAAYLKAPTLWHRLHGTSRRTAAVWWPVTVGADIDFNLPEYWAVPGLYPRRLAPVAEHSTPGLIEKIRQAYPSFGRADFDDRQRVLAARYILDAEKPALFLLHLGDLDSEQHRTGAFSQEARATLELQDELLAYLLEVPPPRTYVAVVSDHGFETQEFVLRPNVLLADAGIESEAYVAEGLIGVRDTVAANHFRSLLADAKYPIAREVSIEEVRRLADPTPQGWLAAFETATGVSPEAARDGPPIGLGDRRGHHGLWPTRADYRASFLLWGPGVKPQVLPEISMLDIAPTFADLLGLDLGPVEGKSLWKRLR